MYLVQYSQFVIIYKLYKYNRNSQIGTILIVELL